MDKIKMMNPVVEMDGIMTWGLNTAMRRTTR